MKLAETWIEPRVQIQYYRKIESKNAVRKLEFEVNINLPTNHPKIKQLYGQVYVGNYVCTEVRTNRFESELDIDLGVLKELVLADLQRVTSYVKEHEQEFIETANECSAKAVQKTLTQQRKELDKAQSRISELNILFRKLYEDNALGKLSDEQFAFLTSGYDEEKKTLTRRIAELSQEIDNATERSADVKRFVALVRRYTAIEELTYENVHEFIDRILIHELDKETNTRKIEIFYSFVGRVDTGDKPTESISYFRQIGADVKSYAI
jgi:cell division protein ZapA (FtsZ GTPase activity inhibitor)